MLSSITYFLKLIAIPCLYIGGILFMIATVFIKAEWGLFLMTALIPQPNIYVKFYDYPMGKNFLDLLFLSAVLGIIIQKKGFEKTTNTLIIIMFIIIGYLSLCNSSMRFSLPMPITTSNKLLAPWKDYVQMIFMYFLVVNIIKDEKKKKIMISIMSLAVLFIALRSYRSFSGGASYTGSRYGGPFEIFGLGANHSGAFMAYNFAMFLGLSLFEKDKLLKWLFLATTLFSLHPILFSYSRGAYLAAFATLVFFGIIKKKSLLILVIVILLAWQTILPASVVDRIMMTETEEGELEHSSAVRLDLWEYAINLFNQNPVFGVGFGGYGLSMPEGSKYTDTHNFFLKTLSEQGIIGSLFLLLILYRAFWSGWRLYKIGNTPFDKGLGFGFLGCILAMIFANMFGDRWSYFVVGGYFWIFWGLVDRGILVSQAVSKEQFHHKNFQK